MLQDSKGYIWIGTDAGVGRFDGRRFENFSIDDGLPDNQILQLKEDKLGRIWFLSLSGQLSYFYNGKIYNENTDPLLKILKFNAIIVAFFEDSKGRLWFGTNRDVLFMWNGKRLSSFSPDKTATFVNAFIHEDLQGKIWAFSTKSAQVFLDSKFILVPEHPIPVSFRTTVNLNSKKLLYLTKKGLYIKNSTEQKLILKIDPKLLENDPGYFYASRTELWLSNNDGIFYIEPSGKTTHYLDNIKTVQALKDNKNNMWFTTTDGIYMLPKPEDRLHIFDKSTGLKYNKVKSIIKDSYERLWLGLEDGRIEILNKDKLRTASVDLSDHKKFNTIKQLQLDAVNKSVFFASDYGIGHLNEQYPKVKKISYFKETNNCGIAIKNFSINKEKNIAIALSSGVIVLKDRINTTKFTNAKLKEGFDFFGNRSYHVRYDNENNLWFSNINGLYQFSSGHLEMLFRKNLLLTKRVNDIAEMKDRTLVLATDGYGVLLIKNGQILNQVTQKQGLANNICKKLFIKDNAIWVVTNNGINRLLRESNKISVEAFEYTNVLLKNDVNDLHIDTDTAYFATNKGLVYFYNKPTKQLQEPPKVLISAILINQEVVGLNGPKIVLDPSSSSITFRYNTIDFQNQEMGFRYRLKSDANWTETKNRRIEFSSLSPGEYKFELCAKTNNSDWSKPIFVEFTINSRFWQNIWFLGLIFLIAGVVFYKIAVVITRQQKNKEQQRLLLKNKILMLEQRALQAMMNPHFVFNVMNSIQHYINTNDTSSANKILTGFARLIRKNMEICTKSSINLAEELSYLELYLSLEKKRFGEKFKYSVLVDPTIDLEETFLPSMLLQPYIENGIWHGIMPKEDGGEIKVCIDQIDDDYLLIQIIDDGIGIHNSFKKEQSHDSKGMALTQERVNLLNQIEVNPIHIDIRQNGNSGTIVSIKIPN